MEGIINFITKSWHNLEIAWQTGDIWGIISIIGGWLVFLFVVWIVYVYIRNHIFFNKLEKLNKIGQEMREIAESRGGESLSNYSLSHMHGANISPWYKFKCSEGHEFEMHPRVIKRGRWCPICAKKPKQNGDS